MLALFDGSVAEKYGHLPPALGEQQRGVPYDPFEISEDLKSYASQHATSATTPLHANSITMPLTQQYAEDTSSLHHSWSSFDSVSSLDGNEANELASPSTAAASRDHVGYDRQTFSSATDSYRAFAGAGDASIKTGSDTDLLTYANIPLPRQSGDVDKLRQPPAAASNYSTNRHSYSHSDCSRPSSNRRRRRPGHQNDQLASQEIVRQDLNANAVPARSVSVGNSLDWVSDAMSQISVQHNTHGQSTAAVSPALAASTAVWDEKSLTRSMRAAKKKIPLNTGSVFYDNADDDLNSGHRDWNSAPPVPPRDHVTDAASSVTQLTDAVYGNIGDRNSRGSRVSSDVSGMQQQLATVHPFMQEASSDMYQNYSEFSATNAGYSVTELYANVQSPEQLPSTSHRSGRSSFSEAVAHGEVGGQARPGDRARPGAVAGAQTGAMERVRRLVPAATPDECQTALVVCFGDVDSAARHLKVEQLTRLGIAPRERCRSLLEACGWNLESAGSVLIHELSTGSAV